MEDSGFKISEGILNGYDGPNVNTLIIPEGIREIEPFALRYCNLKECEKIIFPSTLKVVGRCTLNWHPSKTLKEIEFLGDVETIEENAFERVGLTKVVFHGEVGEIGKMAFYQNSITKLECSTIRNIGTDAFKYCEILKEVRINKIASKAEMPFLFWYSIWYI